MKRLELILKWVVPVVIIWLLYSKVQADLPSVSNIFNNIRIDGNALLLLASLFVLMMLNWLLEALKWQKLIYKLEHITLMQSVKATLNGLAYGLFTPFRVGDIFTRIFHMKSEERRNALGSVFVCRSAQLVSTLVMGVAGAVIYYYQLSDGWSLVLLLLIPLLIYIHYHAKIVLPVAAKLPFLSRYLQYVHIMSDYGAREYTTSLLLSMLRYIVIVVQYLLMFRLYGIDLPETSLFAGVSLTLLLKSILPIMSIVGDFGVREVIAVYVFSAYGLSATPVLLVTISIWLLNIVTPSVIGAFMTKNLRMSR